MCRSLSYKPRNRRDSFNSSNPCCRILLWEQVYPLRVLNVTNVTTQKEIKMSTAVKSNLIHTKELKNWVVFRQFQVHLERLMEEVEEQGDKTLIVEVWSFPKEKNSQKMAGTAIKG